MSGNEQGRRNWTLSMTAALLTAIAAVIVGCMAARDAVVTDRVYLKSSAGSVLFDHGKHNEAASCATCHHDLLSSAPISCEECHGDEVDAGDFEHAELKEFHQRDCTACHEQASDDDQAASCRECHAQTQQSDTRFVGCIECHDDSYEPTLLDHYEYVEIDGHSCLGCHTPGKVSEVYHISCTSCHLEQVPERFANEDGTENCSGCHLR